MILLTTSPARIRKTLLAATLGGIAGGALVPTLMASMGTPAARAAYLAVASGAILLVRGARGVPARAAIAAGFGALAALVEGVLPAGSGPALAGIGLALVLAPEGQRLGAFGRLLRALSGGAFALVGAMAAGELARFMVGTTPVAWDALLGAMIAVGATAGELLHHAVIVSKRPPIELEELRKLSPGGRATVDMARGAYVRTVEAVIAARTLDTVDRIDALTTARDLALTAARSTETAEEIAKTKASVTAGTAGSDQVESTRERVAEQLTRKEQKARDDAARAATALAELAIAIAERGASADTTAEDLAARAESLAFRIGVSPVPRETAAKS
ncbi:MAG TPA: hypothetical protein VFF73_03930 [Planctomycetota bacterium]|nr:hypothetical protein [Planctomycetota bacterium]